MPSGEGLTAGTWPAWPRPRHLSGGHPRRRREAVLGGSLSRPESIECAGSMPASQRGSVAGRQQPCRSATSSGVGQTFEWPRRLSVSVGPPAADEIVASRARHAVQSRLLRHNALEFLGRKIVQLCAKPLNQLGNDSALRGARAVRGDPGSRAGRRCTRSARGDRARTSPAAAIALHRRVKLSTRHPGSRGAAETIRDLLGERCFAADPGSA